MLTGVRRIGHRKTPVGGWGERLYLDNAAERRKPQRAGV